MKKAAIYLRVSTKEQSSLPVQKEMLSKYIEFYNMDKSDSEKLVVSKIYEDDGISAFKGKARPGYLELLTAVKNKEIDAVFVYSISRFARNTKSLLEAVELMNANGVKFHSYKEKIDTSSAVGAFFLTVIGAMAQMESQQMSERIYDAKTTNKKIGRTYSSPIYGFDNNLVSHTLVPNHEMKLVHRIKEMSEYYGYHHIARKLNEEGVPSKKGGKWYASVVHKIVNNSVYNNA